MRVDASESVTSFEERLPSSACLQSDTDEQEMECFHRAVLLSCTDFRSHRSSRYDVLAAMFYDLLVMSLKSGSMRVHICRALPDPYIAAWPASYRTDTLACL